MPDSKGVIKPSWEVGGTVFNTFKALRSLAQAASQDDVQTEAVLAAEALAGGWTFDDKRIAEAYDALKGNESVRWESVNMLIGLSAGGLRREMGKSSSLIRVFLLCAACKLCYINSDIGRILFEMMSHEGLLNKHPVSPSQLTRFVEQLSGHAEKIAPVHILDQVADALDGFGVSATIYSPQGIEALAPLICKTFNELNDDSNVQISLHGHQNGAWLATVMLWLLGSDVSVTVLSQSVMGAEGSRVTVDIKPEDDYGKWVVKTWTTSPKPTEHIFKYDDDYERSLNRFPARSLKMYLRQYYWPLSNRKRCDENMPPASTGLSLSTIYEYTTAAFAEALVLYFLSKSTLYYNKLCCTESQHCAATKLSSIATLKWTSECHRIVTNYGFQAASEVDVERFLLKFDETLPGPDRGYRSELLRGAWDAEIKRRFSEGVCDEDVWQEQSSFLKLYSDSMDAAVFVAVDATLTCTADIRCENRYIAPPSEQSVHKACDLFRQMLGGSMTTSSFANEAVEHLLPGVKSDRDLAISCDGFVAGWSMMWCPGTTQTKALGIVLMRGSITKDNFHYDCIREAPASVESSTGAAEDLIVDEWPNDRKTIFRVQPPPRRFRYRTELLVSMNDRVLELKQYLIKDGDGESRELRRRVSILENVQTVATAHHFKGNGIRPTEERKLAARLAETLLDRPISWAAPIATLSCPGDVRLVMKTEGLEEEIRALAVAAPEPKHCCPIVFGHGAPLVSIITYAESLGRTWIVVP